MNYTNFQVYNYGNLHFTFKKDIICCNDTIIVEADIPSKTLLIKYIDPENNIKDAHINWSRSILINNKSEKNSILWIYNNNIYLDNEIIVPLTTLLNNEDGVSLAIDGSCNNILYVLIHSVPMCLDKYELNLYYNQCLALCQSENIELLFSKENNSPFTLIKYGEYNMLTRSYVDDLVPSLLVLRRFKKYLPRALQKQILEYILA